MNEPTVAEILRASARQRPSRNPVDVDKALRTGIDQLRRRMLAAYAVGALVVILLTTGALVAHFATAAPRSIATTTTTEITTTVTTTPTTSTTTSTPTTTNSTTTSTNGTTTSTSATTPELTSVRVDPDQVSIAIGETRQLRAIGSYSDDHTEDVTSSVTWTSQNSKVATVDASGLVTAVGRVAAETEIVATSGKLSGHSTVVTTVPITLIAITVSALEPNNCSDPFSLTARGTYSDRSTKDITSAVQWTSSNTSFAKVDSSGRVTLVPLASNPSAVIAASMNGVQGTFSIECFRQPH
jgi:hypothetical protein